eukprot:609127-Amphidinium_carterae.1
MVANGSPDVQDSAQQDWEKHHRQGHLTKSPDCPICQRESGTRVVQWCTTARISQRDRMECC